MKAERRLLFRSLLIALCVAVAAAHGASAQVPVGTAFTYQGRLTDGGVPASGAYDLRLILYDSEVGGAQAGGIVTRDDVAVASGLFTVTLDFGAVFSGSKRWLEVSVRPGASTGTYTPLAPRQELTAAPNAVFAGNAATIAGLACANGQVAKWSNGWTCGADVTNTGTVTSVATGAGLTGGPITGSGTVSVAPLGITTGLLADAAVTSLKIANGAVGTAQINQTQIQARVGGTCGLGEYLRGINPDGTVVCGALANTITTVDDPADDLNLYTSIAIGPGGAPVVSYFDYTAKTLKLARCGNAACTAGNVVTTVDDPPANDVGDYNAIAIGSDGLPVISYHDATAGALKVLKCSNPACTSSQITTVDDPPTNSLGFHVSMAIGPDALPVISYQDATIGALKVAKCSNVACTASMITIVDDPPVNVVGTGSSIAVGSDGFPVISYGDSTAQALKVAKCSNAACTASTITTIDDPATNSVGFGSSIAIGSDGFPIVSYTDGTAGALKVAKCGNLACTVSSVITVDAPPANRVGYDSSLEIGTDGLPVISYADVTANALKVAKCGNAACTVSTITTVDDPPVNQVGRFTSIAVGSDGLPVISYLDATASALKILKCGNAACR